MAIGGMEQMMVAVLLKLGLDPEELKAMALGVQKIAKDSGERLTRLEETLARIELKIDKLIPHSAGGFELGDGSADDIKFREGMGDVILPLPSADTLRIVEHESELSEV